MLSFLNAQHLSVYPVSCTVHVYVYMGEIIQQFFSYIMAREKVNVQWDDDEIRFFSTNMLSWNFIVLAGRHVAPLGHIIPIPSKPVFALSFKWCLLAENQQIPILQFLVRLDWGSNPLEVIISAQAANGAIDLAPILPQNNTIHVLKYLGKCDNKFIWLKW